MAALYWIVKVYKWILIAWVLMTWIPGIAGSVIHSMLGLLVWPVLKPFDFLVVGPIGLGPIIPLLILNFLETWLGKRAGLITDEPQAAPPQQPDGAVDVRDLKPATPPDGSPSNTGI